MKSRLVIRLCNKLWSYDICTGSACYSTTSGCNAPCPHEHSFRDTTHTVLPKLNAWPETTIAQRNTEGHQSRSNNKRPKPSFTSTQRCQEWKELNNQPMNNGWFLYKLGLRLSPHTKGWSKANKPRWPCHEKLQSYFSKLWFYTDIIPLRLVLSPVCSTKATD